MENAFNNLIWKTFLPKLLARPTQLGRPKLGRPSKVMNLEAGSAAVYKQTGEKVTVLKVHREDPEDEYYTIKFSNGRERQTTENHLTTMRAQVTINVAGTEFTTTYRTLLIEGSVLGKAGATGEFIDRDNSHFRLILNYLRDKANGDAGSVALPESHGELVAIAEEAKFYELRGLEKQVQMAMRRTKNGQNGAAPAAKAARVSDTNSEDHAEKRAKRLRVVASLTSNGWFGKPCHKPNGRVMTFFDATQPDTDVDMKWNPTHMKGWLIETLLNDASGKGHVSVLCDALSGDSSGLSQALIDYHERVLALHNNRR